MEPASLQLTVLAIASLLAAGAAVAAFVRALGPAGKPSSDLKKPSRSTQIVWALVPLLVLGSVLLAMVNTDG